jgi:multiple sugar transport system ATP-binding protein
MATLSLAHVCKIYEGDVMAVEDVNLEIEDREFVVLVGPSGCGKSTTLRMIAGLEDISSGTISIDGRVVNRVPSKDRDIAMVFQSYALYPHMTVYENMAFGLSLRKVPRADIDRKVRQAAETLDISRHLDKLPKHLSGGQRQRVALGRAIVRQPKCFLFDEPLSNLDAKLRVEMRAEIKRLHIALQTTTVYVTHDQEEAITLGDRVVVMKDGIIQQCAPALEIYRRPANRFVAGFLGNPPMNFLAGRLVGAGTGPDRDHDAPAWFDEGSGCLAIPAWAAAALRGRIGQPVVLGVRPEALAVRSQARFPTRDTGGALQMTVQLVQPLGDRMDVQLATAAHPRIVAQVDADSGLSVGDSLPIHVDLDRLHFFEAEGEGKALASAPPTARAANRVA